jgi:sn-glycerol 3-phosphate transport system substrate-binding protein
MRPRHRSLTLLAAAAVVLAACGGGDDGGADTAPATTAAPPSETTGGTATSPPTTQLPTTTTIPVEELATCPVTALDAAAGPVEIVFWHAMSADNNTAIDELVAAYNASQDKVRVTAVFQGGYDDNFDKYRTASPADRPDVVQLPEYYLQTMVDSDTTIPAESCVSADADFAVDQVVERARTAYTLEGVLWTMPFNVSNPVLYYNKLDLAAAGLDPEQPPRTLEEWQAASEAVVASGAATWGAAIDTGPDAGGGWVVEHWLAKADLPYADNGNGRAGRATQVLYDTQDTADLLTVLQDMVESKVAVNVGENASGTDTLFKLVDTSEPAAMSINSSAYLGGALNALRSGLAPGFTDADLGIGPMPGPVGDGGTPVGGATLWLVKDKGDERAAAAWDFITFLVSAQSQSTWAAATGYVPVNEGAEALDPLRSLYEADPRFRVAYDQLVGGADTVNAAGPVIGPLRQVRAVTAEAVRSILAGADPLPALEQAAAEADDLIADYNRRVGA